MLEITPFNLTAVNELFPFLEEMLNTEIEHFQWSVVKEIDFRRIQEQDLELKSEASKSRNLGTERVLSKMFYSYDDQNKLTFKLEVENNLSVAEANSIGELLYVKKLTPSHIILLDTSFVSDGNQQKTTVKIKIYSLNDFNLERYFEEEIYLAKSRINLWLSQPK